MFFASLPPLHFDIAIKGNEVCHCSHRDTYSEPRRCQTTEQTQKVPISGLLVKEKK